MRIETLAKRLAQKTNTPVLEDVVLGKRPVQDLPMDHMMWTGAMDGKFDGYKVRKALDRRGEGYYLNMVRSYPIPIIRWQGAKIAVHRLIFQLINKPDYEFRMKNTCCVLGCVNPLHWTAEAITRNEPEPDAVPDFMMASDDAWTDEEVEEMLEILFTEQSPANWGDVMTAPLMEGAPEDKVQRVLAKLNRRHLLPCNTS